MAPKLRLQVENHRHASEFLKGDKITGFLEVTPNDVDFSTLTLRLIQRIRLGDSQSHVFFQDRAHITSEFGADFGLEGNWIICSESSGIYPFLFEDVQLTHGTLDGDKVGVPVSLRYYIQATLETNEGRIIHEQEIPVLMVPPTSLVDPRVELEYDDNIMKVDFNMVRRVGLTGYAGNIGVFIRELSSKFVVKKVVVDLHRIVTYYEGIGKGLVSHEATVGRVHDTPIKEPEIEMHYGGFYVFDPKYFGPVVPTFEGVAGGLLTLRYVLKLCLVTADGNGDETDTKLLAEKELVIYPFQPYPY